MTRRNDGRAIRAALIRALCVLAAMVILPTSAVGQVVAGQVVDAITGAPVAGVSIRALDAGGEEQAGVVADSAGRFAIPLSPGLHAFRIEHLGYETLETEPIEMVRGERLQVEIRIGPRPLEMDALVVHARQLTRRSQFERRMEQHQRTGLGRFITREEIEQTPVIGVNELLAREMGLEITTMDGSRVIMMRGRGRTCMPALYVDGMPITNDARIPTDLSSFFHSPDQIEGIEIYRSPLAAPADLRTGGCGAIVVWTRMDAGGRPFTWRRLAFAAAWVGLFLLLRGI
jgi:hypothetical protein